MSVDEERTKAVKPDGGMAVTCGEARAERRAPCVRLSRGLGWQGSSKRHAFDRQEGRNRRRTPWRREELCRGRTWRQRDEAGVAASHCAHEGGDAESMRCNAAKARGLFGTCLTRRGAWYIGKQGHRG
ncbi:hypothetical protein TRVL_09492 [Trypanosoma vivax]|nr:hypothetical protein TRVL_09492 [Trypanosoma vivax]